MSRRHDVLVVGAGPAGATAARALAEAGRDVALLDENDGSRCGIVCTGIVGAEAFQRFDLPREAVVDRVLEARFISPAGVEVPYQPGEPLARVVDRSVFDEGLVDRAVDAGAELRRGFAARAVEKSEDGVTVVGETSSGRARVDGRSLVVATGHQRWLHEEADLGTPDDYVHGVHADLPFRDLESAELYFGNELAPGYFAWAVPFGNEARLGLLVPQGARQLFDRLLEVEDVRSRVALPGDLESWRGDARSRLRSRAIVQGAVRPSYSDRVLAVGEAAGQVKTTTAGGIYYGMIGAQLAAETLDDALTTDRLGARRLSSYEDRWLDEIGDELEAGRRLQEVGRKMDDEEIDELFEALNDGLGATVRRLVKFDWHRSALRAVFRHRKVRSFLAA